MNKFAIIKEVKKVLDNDYTSDLLEKKQVKDVDIIANKNKLQIVINFKEKEKNTNFRQMTNLGSIGKISVKNLYDDKGSN